MKGYYMITGIQNEKEIIKCLNNKRFCDLNNNLKKLIRFIYGSIEDDSMVYAWKPNSFYKTDIVIKVNTIEKNLSIKTGSENSVHIEKLSSFVDFLRGHHINEGVINDLKLYHYGDDTYDGTGIKRYSAEESKLRYTKEIFGVNKYVSYNNILKIIIDRFLFLGMNNSDDRVDYIYYGDSEYGIWASRKEIMYYLILNKCYHLKTIHFSALTYQNWCRNVNRNNKSEAHRDYIQIKWFSIVSDLQKIRNNKLK